MILVVLYLDRPSNELLQQTTLVVFLHVFVEMSGCSGIIRIHPKQADTKRKDTQEKPSDKGEHQIEVIKFMTLHHCHTELDSLIILQLRIVLQNKACLAIGYGLDDAWNKQQQAPQNNVNGFQKLGCQNTAIILETIKHLFNLEG